VTRAGLTLLLVAGLTGCGGDEDASAPPAPGASTTTVPAATETTAAPTSTGRTVTAEVTTPTGESGGTAAPETETETIAPTETASGGTESPSRPKRKPQPAAKREVAAAYFAPRAGTSSDTFTLFVSGFRPGATLSVALTAPDGESATEYRVVVGSDGSGKLTVPQQAMSATGTYTAVAKNTATGASATAEALVAG
jgi:hypothetical protein